MKKIGFALEKALYVISAVVFFPVLFCVIFIGNNMNYNDGLKMEVLRPNWLLFLIASVVMVLSFFLLHICNKYFLQKIGDLWVNIFLIILSVCVYFISLWIAREIAFQVPWDVKVVGTTAAAVADEVPIGYFSYLSLYTNNIPITYILGKLLHYAKNTIDYAMNPQFIWIQINCLLMTASILFSALTVKRLTKNAMFTFIAFMLNFLLIGLSAWKIAPYTDTYGQLFPVLAVYLYICYRQAQKTWKKTLLMVLSLLSCVVGGLMKPSVYIVLIALFMSEILFFLLKEKTDLRCLLLQVIVAAVMLIAAEKYQAAIVEKIGLEVNENIEASAVGYFYMGLNETTMGSYSSDDAAIYGEFQFMDKKERDAIVLQRAFDRIDEKGFAGTISFWLRKMVMIFNDGLFGWRTEVWIDSLYSPEVCMNTPFMEFLREVYWEGRYVGAYNTIMQLVWIYCLLGIAGMFLQREKEKAGIVLILCFMGIFFYQMLFEARARYLFVFLPLLIVCAVYGMYQYFLLWNRKRNESVSATAKI